jgi:hypothetical protein
LVDVVEAAACAGDLDRAEAIARAITSPDQRTQALGVVLEAAAGTGELDRARVLAERIKSAAARANISPNVRARALAQLARGAMPDQARSLLAQALTVGHWEMSVLALIQIDPVAFGTIANEYSSSTPVREHLPH